MKRGQLVCFEGIDGCGKSTQLGMLAASLRAAGHAVVETAEPSDGEWGRRIREMARSGARVAPAEELRWFVEDRREHVREVVQPALEEGCVVLSDRYTLSSVAYQGARGLDWREILAAGEAEFPIPELVLLLVIDPAAGLARVHGRGEALETAFEERVFLKRVAEIFRAIERDYLERIPAEGTPDEVAALVRQCLERRLAL